MTTLTVQTPSVDTSPSAAALGRPITQYSRRRDLRDLGGRRRARWACSRGSSRPPSPTATAPSRCSGPLLACLTVGLDLAVRARRRPRRSTSSARCAGPSCARRCGSGRRGARRPARSAASSGGSSIPITSGWASRRSSRSRRRSTATWASSSRRTPARRCSTARGACSPSCVTMFVFNTVLGEELLFRGVLLPRMNGAFGEARLGRQRRAVRGVPPPHAVGHPGLARRHVPRRLSGEALPERVDQHRRAQRAVGAVHGAAADPRPVGERAPSDHTQPHRKRSRPRSSDLGCVTRRTARSPRDIGWDTTRHDRPARAGAGPGSGRGPRAGRRSGRSGAIRRTGQARRSSIAEQRHTRPRRGDAIGSAAAAHHAGEQAHAGGGRRARRSPRLSRLSRPAPLRSGAGPPRAPRRGRPSAAGSRRAARRGRPTARGSTAPARRQLGHPAPDVGAVGVEALALGHGVEDPEERRRVGAGAGHPLPAVLVGREVAVDQVLDEEAAHRGASRGGGPSPGSWPRPCGPGCASSPRRGAGASRRRRAGSRSDLAHQAANRVVGVGARRRPACRAMRSSRLVRAVAGAVVEHVGVELPPAQLGAELARPSGSPSRPAAGGGGGSPTSGRATAGEVASAPGWSRRSS